MGRIAPELNIALERNAAQAGGVLVTDGKKGQNARRAVLLRDAL